MEEKHPVHRKHYRWQNYHNYKDRNIYHITLVVSDNCQVFGRIVDAREENSMPNTQSSSMLTIAYPNQQIINQVNPSISEANQPSWQEKQLEDGSVVFIDPDGKVWTEQMMARSATVALTPLGQDIKKEIKNIPTLWDHLGVKAKILALTVMPEHVHFVLFIEKEIEQPLQILMRGWKQGANRLLRKYLGLEGKSPLDHETMEPAAFIQEAIDAARRKGGTEATGKRILEEHALFEKDFDVTRLRGKGQLNAMITYVQNNPSHRWLRIHKPSWLLPIRGIEIAGRYYDAIGNIKLLTLPREQVHCRFRWEQENDTDARRAHQNNCVLKARNGHALVSPFISPHEAAVRDVCLKEGNAIIQLMDNGFSDLQQCPGKLYDYCAAGQVLLLIPSDWPHQERKGRCTRAECNALNNLAKELVEAQRGKGETRSES